MPPARQYSQSAMPLLPISTHAGSSGFCTEENISECMSYISEELSSLGLPSISCDLNGILELDVILTLNIMYDLLQLHRCAVGTVNELEIEQMKISSDLNSQRLTVCKLKDQLELSIKENDRFREREQQLEATIKVSQSCLKCEKDEVKKLQNVIASRATQYNHNMKRKEREFNQLKVHISQLLTNKKDMKHGMEVLNVVGRPDGRRGQWKTGKTNARHDAEMYKTLLDDFEKHQRELMLENVELKTVLQQMKQEMVAILCPKKHSQKEEKYTQLTDEHINDEEETSFKDALEMSCEHARERLTNSIRQQWRKLKHHVENLDNKASMVELGPRFNEEMIPKQFHQEEIESLRMEIQQCKDFIKTQQQLLQQQLHTPCDEDTAAVLNDCYMLEEKERLKEERNSFEEQRKNFEMERRRFTEAAIRLGHERKMFEEDRANWLKHQFLNMSFTEQTKTHSVSSEYSGLEQKYSIAPKTPL